MFYCVKGEFLIRIYERSEKNNDLGSNIVAVPCNLSSVLGTILKNGVFMKTFRPDHLRIYGHKRRGIEIPGSVTKSAKAD